jgi:lysophospholipase L1-like esterase
LASNNYLTDTGLATGSTGYAGQTRAGLEAYVTAIKDLAAEYNIIYVPVYEYMRDNGGASLMAADNIHPNDAGHAVIKDIMLNPALYAGVAADTTAPIASSAAVANSTPTTLSVTFSEALNTSYVPDVSSVTVSGHTASALAVSGNTMIVTVNAYVSGEAASAVAYTQPATNGLRDAAGNLVASFSGLAVTNNVTGATVYPRFASPVGMTESGTGPYVYTGDGTAASGDGLVHGGMLNQSLQSGVDGSFSARMSTRPTGKSAYIGLNSVNAAAIATAIPYVVYASSSSNNYVAVANGVAQTVANTIAAAANDILRLRRTGTSIVGEVSKNAGSTWTTIYTWTSAPTTQLYYQMQLTGTVVADTLTSVGLA